MPRVARWPTCHSGGVSLKLSCHPLVILRSELQLQVEEKTPTIVERVGYLSEGRRTQIRVRVGKLRCVEQVDRLAPKAEAPFRVYSPRTRERRVQITNTIPAKRVEAQIPTRLSNS